ncbi:MAG: hypothetical protein H6737_00575 [Alphaproteobacteria bacterium]|nr:hypothetical protein [Alphaproteobacteria bacterium]
MRVQPWVAMGLAVLTGCKGVSFTVSDESEIVVEQGTLLEALLNDLQFGGFADLDITSRDAVANQGVEPGDINDVRFDELVLSATAPTDADLSFIESLSFYVEADGLDAMLVASQDDFPEGQAVVPLDLEDVDLTDYVVQPSMTLTTNVTGSRPGVDTTVLAAFTLRIRATGKGIFGQLKKEDE